MNIKRFPWLSVALLCAFVTADVYAGQLVQCEKRMTPARSKVRVEAEKVKPNALYTAVVKSGANRVSSTRAANAFGKVTFAYDSNRKDILSGKKAISPRFIAYEVDVWVYDALGNIVAQKPDTACRIR